MSHSRSAPAAALPTDDDGPAAAARAGAKADTRAGATGAGAGGGTAAAGVAAGADTRAAVGALTGAGCGSGAGATAPCVSRDRITEPWLTVSPSLTFMTFTMPACDDGISIEALSLSTVISDCS